jgi:hypothetical protein
VRTIHSNADRDRRCNGTSHGPDLSFAHVARTCVASTCSTSLVPIPKANAPNAPCVAVWESPHTVTHPGRVNPCSGPTM